jgi:hypothetical protein
MQMARIVTLCEVSVCGSRQQRATGAETLNPRLRRSTSCGVLLQASSVLKERTFEQVHLARAGNVRFRLDGAYFKRLGEEYGVQNPICTMRTLPENVLKPDGTKAFPTWEGGLLGVAGKQMEDLTAFVAAWVTP